MDTGRVVVAVVLALALVVPTGAVLTGGFGDRTTYTELGVVLAPTTGANGGYADVHGDGTVTLDLTGVGGNDTGVNPDGLTTVDRLFLVENRGDEPRRVWLTTDAVDPVTFTTVGGAPVPGPNSSRVLEPGERFVVSVAVDTTGVDTEPGTALLSFVQLHVAELGDATPTPTETGTETRTETPTPTETETPTPTPTPTPDGSDRNAGGGGGSGGSGGGSGGGGGGSDGGSDDDGAAGGGTGDDTPTETPVSTPTGTPVETPTGTPTDETPGGTPTAGDTGVTVTFDDGTAANVTGIDLGDVIERDDDTDPRPTAVVRGNRTDLPDGAVARGAQSFTTVGETVSLDGTPSLIDTTRTVDPDRRLLTLVNVTVPADKRNETATLRMRVDRAAFEGTDPSAARIGHHTGTGWQLLTTTVVSETADTVVVETRTDEFSPFGLFREPRVTYTWTLPDGTTRDGAVTTARFDEAGLKNVSLQVTNAFGRSDTTDYPVLVNDRPAATIRVDTDAGSFTDPAAIRANTTAGDEVTLVANVTDEVGRESDREYVWQLPDGAVVRGERVSYELPAGEQTVRLRVTDEFGAETTATLRLQGGDAGGDPVAAVQDTVDAFQFGLDPATLGAVLVGVGLLLAVGLARRRLDTGWLAVAGHPPSIREFGRPRLDTAAGRFELSTLRVEDPGGDVELIEVTVARDGDPVFVAEVPVDHAREFEASPLAVDAPVADLLVDAPHAVTVRVVDAAGDDDTVTREGRFRGGGGGGDADDPGDTDDPGGTGGAGDAGDTGGAGDTGDASGAGDAGDDTGDIVPADDD